LLLIGTSLESVVLTACDDMDESSEDTELSAFLRVSKIPLLDLGHSSRSKGLSKTGRCH